MIVVKLLGGLGNQLFQYAAGRALADRHGSELFMDMAYFKEEHGMTPRPFELDKLNCGIQIAVPGRIDRIVNRSRAQKLADKIFPYRRYHLQENQEFPVVSPGKKMDVYLDGYWQSENYFRSIEKTIRLEFTFRSRVNTETEKLAAEILKNERPVSVHIRRGDYLASEAMKNWLGVCSVDYYHKAFKYICDRIGEPYYYVFSDDLDWVKENIIRENTNMQAVAHNRGSDSWQDMYLMSLCRHHIIANSSFSWWGAWLDPNPGKIVIAPEKWFLESTLHHQVKNIVPNHWIRM
jgi:hypothetical protein